MNSQLVLPGFGQWRSDRSLSSATIPTINGSGPEGRTCGDCAHLRTKTFGRRSYFKCGMRRNTNGPGTDIRKKWPACQAWEQQRLSDAVAGGAGE